MTKYSPSKRKKNKEKLKNVNVMKGLKYGRKTGLNEQENLEILEKLILTLLNLGLTRIYLLKIRDKIYPLMNFPWIRGRNEKAGMIYSSVIKRFSLLLKCSISNMMKFKN